MTPIDYDSEAVFVYTLIEQPNLDLLFELKVHICLAQCSKLLPFQLLKFIHEF